MKDSVKYKNRVIRVRHAFKMDHHCEEIIAWNDETNSPDFFTNGQGSEYLRVDADEATLAKWDDYQEKKNKRIEERDRIYQLSVIKKGSKIKAVRGRKVKKGTIGTVYAVYENSYSACNQRIYFLDENGDKLNTYWANLQIEVNGEWVDPNWEHTPEYSYTCAGTY